MTISKTPRTDYRHAHKDPQTHRFTKRPDSAVTRLETPPIGRMPRTPDGLSDDAWPQMQAGDKITVFGQPYTIVGNADDLTAEPIERETWFSWRDWEWSDLWAVGFVGVVIAFGTHLAGLWGQ